MAFLQIILLGFLLTAAAGFAVSWVDRKVTARVQYRVGPPLLQPVYDIVKLLGKETLIPVGVSPLAFFGAPMLGLASVILVATLLWVNNLNPQGAFVGDLIVVVYLLTIPSLSLILGGFASRNAYATLGASREMKLILSYELPFILAILVPVLQSGSAWRLGQILSAQAAGGLVLFSWSGAVAFVVAVLCVQAKLGLVPFDIAEAETEITSGPLIEYSGPALALYKLTKNMLLFVLPFFLVMLFMGGVRLAGLATLIDILKIVGVVAIITVIRNTNPRVRIDQAVRFFWGPVTGLAVIAVLLAVRGY